MSAPDQYAPKVHVQKAPARKWHMGLALCNRKFGRYTKLSNAPKKVTCRTCTKRLLEVVEDQDKDQHKQSNKDCVKGRRS